MLKTLENGVRIVFEKSDNVRSCTVGIWVENGSRYEPLEINGMSHFIEHMMFKGTNTRSAKEIASEMDYIGGRINAFTTKECTCYYIKALDIHLNKGIDILTDMFFNSAFEDKEIELERAVILEEISMYEDQPEDVVFEKLQENIFKNSSLGLPILGTKETLNNINSKTMHEFKHTNYVPSNIVVSICGSFYDEHIKTIEDLFLKMEKRKKPEFSQAKYEKAKILVEKDIEQNHIAIGFNGISAKDDKRYALQLLNGILGAGMSSRLFQKVREEHGLCYSISAFNSANLDSGIYSIYTALSKNTEEKALKLIKEVVLDLLENKITQDEFLRQREQIKANILMSLEDTSSRMNFMARAIIFHGKILSSDEIIQKYDSVSYQDIMDMAYEILDFSNASICVVGDISNEKIYDDFIK